MGRIQTDIGLVSGFPIGDTVDKLIALSARPRDNLVTATKSLQSEQAAITELAALLVAVQLTTDNLGKEDLYDQRTVTSSNESVLTATLTGDPPIGNFQFTPLRMAQSQQLLSSGLRSDTDPLGGGTLTFRFGGHLLQSAALEALNGGAGVPRGRFRITDRSGASAEIDLSAAQSIDDVLDAINNASGINVTATAFGDRIRLVDNTGLALSNLKVQEVAGGTTAASLGLAGIDVADSIADGQDILFLSRDSEVALLNDGNGITTNHVMADIAFELRDGTTGTIDLSPIIENSSEVDVELTLGEIIDRINEAAPDKLRVEIAADGDRLVLTDLTDGAGEFRVESQFDSPALADLGLDGEAVDGVIVGRRLHGGLKTVLLDSLNGGSGLGSLGALELTDRSGRTDTVDLSAAATLEEVLQTINAADVDILARVNQARTGIELVDTSGAAAGNMIVASADSTGTAEKLGIAVDADVESVGSGDLHLQIISENTLLADLNGGKGIARGTVELVDSRGVASTLRLTGSKFKTVGDVIREINRLSSSVHAEINQTGDGILIRDVGGGSGTLQITDGESTTGADLHILGTAKTLQVGGQTVQAIDGSTTYTIELGEADSLDDLRQKINDLGAGVQATTLVDGSTRPFRLSLVSQRPGEAGALVIDASQLGITFQETVEAQDALLILGTPSSTGSHAVISSSSNTFKSVLTGMTLEIKQPSSVPVTVSVQKVDTDLVATLETMVENYNKFRDRLQELTAYNVDTNEASVLTGDGAALRLDIELSHLLSGRFFGSESVQSLAELGIDLKDDGTLEFDKEKFRERLADDPDAVERFFTDEDKGMSARFNRLIEQLAGMDKSLLTHRMEAIQKKIQQNQKRIEFLTERLEQERQRLLSRFYQMEAAIGRMQTNLDFLSRIQPITPLTSTKK